MNKLIIQFSLLVISNKQDTAMCTKIMQY